MKMTQRESRIFNSFCDYYDELVDSHLTEGCLGVTDQREIDAINVGIAIALTINKLLEEDRRI